MDRPNLVSTAELAVAERRAGRELRLLGRTALVHVVCGLVGAALGIATTRAADASATIAAQAAVALATLGSAAGALAYLMPTLLRLDPRFLRDRSVTGCAWFGASDAAVANAALAGGAIAVASMFLLPPPSDTPPALLRFADWHIATATLFAFAAIAVAPVAEELAFRGVLSAALCRRMPAGWSAALTTLAFAAYHYPQASVRPTALGGVLLVGIAAQHLRWRHASLAPAIALHCGYNFVACLALSLA